MKEEGTKYDKLGLVRLLTTPRHATASASRLQAAYTTTGGSYPESHWPQSTQCRPFEEAQRAAHKPQEHSQDNSSVVGPTMRTTTVTRMPLPDPQRRSSAYVWTITLVLKAHSLTKHSLYVDWLLGRCRCDPCPFRLLPVFRPGQL